MLQSRYTKTLMWSHKGASQPRPVETNAQTGTRTPRQFSVEEWLPDVEPATPFDDERHLIGSFHLLVGLPLPPSFIAARLVSNKDGLISWQNPLGAIGEFVPCPIDQEIVKIRNSKVVTPLRVHAWIEFITLLRANRLRRTTPWNPTMETALEFPTPLWTVLRTDEKWVAFSWEVMNAVYDAKCFLFSLIPREQQLNELIQSEFCDLPLMGWIEVSSHFASNTQQLPPIYQLATALGERKAKFALVSALSLKLLRVGVNKAQGCDYYKLLTWFQERGFYLPGSCSGLIKRITRRGGGIQRGTWKVVNDSLAAT